MNTTQYVNEETYALVLVIETAVDKEQLRMIREMLATEKRTSSKPGVTIATEAAGAPAQTVTNAYCEYCGEPEPAPRLVCVKSPDRSHHFVELPF